MFFDVSFERNESLVDEVGDFLIGVRLSFQPSTCASSGRGRKINQQGFVLSFGFGKGSLCVFLPINGHDSAFLFESVQAVRDHAKFEIRTPEFPNPFSFF